MLSHLYKRVCPSVGRSVRPSVGRSVRPSVGPSHTSWISKKWAGSNKIASGIRKYAIWKTIQRQLRGQLARTHLLSELCSTCSYCFSFFSVFLSIFLFLSLLLFALFFLANVGDFCQTKSFRKPKKYNQERETRTQKRRGSRWHQKSSMVEFYLTPNEFQRWILSWNTLPGWAFVIWLCFFHIRIDMILSSFFFLLLCLLLRLLLLLLLLLILLLLITISIVLAASSPSLFPSSLSSPPRFSPLLTPPPFLVSFLTDPWRQHFYLIWLSVLLFYLAVTKEKGWFLHWRNTSLFFLSLVCLFLSQFSSQIFVCPCPVNHCHLFFRYLFSSLKTLILVFRCVLASL